jgi:Protein of unknown function (DUF2924)
MASQIPDQIAKLLALSRSELLDLWQKLYKKAAPPSIRREIMVPFLAYRVQENAYGSLKPDALLELHRIARAIEKNGASSKPLVRPRIRTGTRLFRQWRGQTHEVFVTESGFEYRGVGYRSLSEIARKITATRWSGPAFFGLKTINSVPGRHDE